jgi:hypothetical protein
VVGSEGTVGETFTVAADGKVPTSPFMESGVVGDNPVEAAKMEADQKKEDALKKAKEETEYLEQAMQASMKKYGDALTSTFNEIMYGPPKKEEGK